MSKNRINLPKLSLITIDLIDSLKSDSISDSVLLNLIKSDPILIVLIIKNANSAIYGKQNTNTIERAIAIIGRKKLLSICIAYQFESAFYDLSKEKIKLLKTYMFISSNLSIYLSNKINSDVNLGWICSYILCIGECIGEQFEFKNEFKIKPLGIENSLINNKFKFKFKLRWIGQYKKDGLSEADFLSYYLKESKITNDMYKIIKYAANPTVAKDMEIQKISLVVYLSSLMAEFLINKYDSKELIKLLPMELLNR